MKEDVSQPNILATLIEAMLSFSVHILSAEKNKFVNEV